MASNLTTLMEIQAQEIVDERTRYLKLNCQINYAQALSKMQHQIVSLIIIKSDDIVALIKQTVEYLSRTNEAVREGRSYPPED